MAAAILRHGRAIGIAILRQVDIIVRSVLDQVRQII